MDWDSDPELRAMRDEFVGSFGERKQTLTAAWAKVAAAKTADDRASALEEVASVAHKVAGSAESYGFPTLSQIGGAMDDLLSFGSMPAGADGVAAWGTYAELLGEALGEAAISKKNPARFETDPRFEVLAKEAAKAAEEAE